MKITLKLYATLGQYLPPDAQRNVAEIDVQEGETVAALLEQMQLPAELTHLVLVNGVYIYPDDRASKVLQSHDQLAVFPPIAGG